MMPEETGLPGVSADRIDHYVVVHLLRLPEEPIGSFRRAHDPTADLIGPHVTLVFPVPVVIGGDAIREHVRDVVSRTPSFDIRLRGLEEWWDHWLFLHVADGREEVVALHDALYSGVLRPYLRTDLPYVPHVGLGLFAEERDAHDLLEVRPRTLDRVHILGLDEDLTRIVPVEEIPLG